MKKESNPKHAEEYLSKALRVSQNNYGTKNYVSDLLGQIFMNHKNIRANFDKLSLNIAQSKAIT